MNRISIPIFVSLLVFANGLVEAQSDTADQVAIRYAATITTADLHDYLSIIASDALEGRDTGERGQKMAAA